MPGPVAQPADSADLTIRPVTADRWPDLERLFEAPGGPKYCWCMVWRPMPPDRSRKSRDDKKATLAEAAARGPPIGLLAYRDGEPVAWCSVAPRPTYRRMGPDVPGVANDAIWSIVRLFVKRPLRKSGVMTRMIDAAVDHARQAGAAIIEAYPVAADAPSYRFMGFVPLFREAGFTEVGPIGTRRHLMQRRLD